MVPVPGPLAASRIALMPDGSLVEAVLDSGGTACARWYSGSTWSRWWEIGTNAVDVSVAAANVNSAATAYVCVVFAGSPGGRGVYSFTANGGPVGTSF